MEDFEDLGPVKSAPTVPPSPSGKVREKLKAELAELEAEKARRKKAAIPQSKMNRGELIAALEAEIAKREAAKAAPHVLKDNPYVDIIAATPELVIRNSKTGEEKLWDYEKKTWGDRKGAWDYLEKNFKSIKWPSEHEDIRRANLPPPPEGYQGPFNTETSYYFSYPISHFWIAGIISSIVTFLFVLFGLMGLIRLIGWIGAGFKDN